MGAKALASGQSQLQSLYLQQNNISCKIHAQVESQLRLSREAGLVAARCRLALAMGCVARLCAHSVLADCPVDCISICGTHCSRQLVMRVSSSNDGWVPTCSFGAKTAWSSLVESAPAFSVLAKPA